jgi:hypothetical protein
MFKCLLFIILLIYIKNVYSQPPSSCGPLGQRSPQSDQCTCIPGYFPHKNGCQKILLVDITAGKVINLPCQWDFPDTFILDVLFMWSEDVPRVLLAREGIFRILYDGQNIILEGNFTNGFLNANYPVSLF